MANVRPFEQATGWRDSNDSPPPSQKPQEKSSLRVGGFLRSAAGSQACSVRCGELAIPETPVWTEYIRGPELHFSTVYSVVGLVTPVNGAGASTPRGGAAGHGQNCGSPHPVWDH